MKRSHRLVIFARNLTTAFQASWNCCIVLNLSRQLSEASWRTSTSGADFSFSRIFPAVLFLFRERVRQSHDLLEERAELVAEFAAGGGYRADGRTDC